MSGTFDLERFAIAQAEYEKVLHELTSGQKRSHWMWYIFPQIQGLGNSDMAQRYAICSTEEAKAYLGHPILGPRLKECVKAVVDVQGRTSVQIFGYTDSVKFRSCLTLFKEAAPDCDLFQFALEKYYAGEADDVTLRILNRL
jgi:uncharacterized protein (DUF1810 family)